MSVLAVALGLDQARLESIIEALRERRETVATAESLTGGLVCAALTSVPGSSAAVRGGLVVYATDLKVRLAGVNGRALSEHGPVRPAVAEELAVGAGERCQATWGLGLTGVAGPDPQDGVAPGTVHIGLSGHGKVQTSTIQVPGDRHTVRAVAVAEALDLLWAALVRSKVNSNG